MNYNAKFVIPETVIQRCRLFVDMDGTLVVGSTLRTWSSCLKKAISERCLRIIASLKQLSC